MVLYEKEELEALVTMCRKLQVIVLSDEIYARLRFDGKHVALSKIYPEGTILTSGKYTLFRFKRPYKIMEL